MPPPSDDMLMIDILVNDQPQRIQAPLTLDQFLIQQQLDKPYTAVSVNHQFIPKPDYRHYRLQQNDKIDIVTPMQGG